MIDFLVNQFLKKKKKLLIIYSISTKGKSLTREIHNIFGHLNAGFFNLFSYFYN